LLAASGKLFFNQKPIVCDFFSKNEFYFQVDESDGKVIISGHLKSGSADFEMKDCDFVCAGPPHFFIKGISLKFISSDVTWLDIKKAIGGELTPDDLVEEPDNPDAPKIIYTKPEAKQSTTAKHDPLPELVLKDRTGAFADLWMNYGHDQKVSFHELGKTPFQRDPESEAAWEKDLLETGYQKKWVSTSHYYCPMDKIGKSLAFLLELGWKIHDWQGNTLAQAGKIDLEMQHQAHAIRVKGKIKFNHYDADLTQVAGAFNKKEKFLKLGQGTVGLLPDQWADAGMQSLLEEGEIEGTSLKIHSTKMGALADLWGNRDVKVDDTLTNLQERLQNFKGITTTNPGIQFKGELRPYQQEGVNWLSFLFEYGFHGILADDMGLGKTVQVLAFLSQLQLLQPVLIVLPTSLIFNWKKEIERFLPGQTVLVHHGSQRSRVFDVRPGMLILTSYTTLRIDLPLFLSMDFQCVILDEAQVIKNAQTQTAQAVCRLNAQFRLSITGTPVENHLSELWSHFHFLIPELLGEHKEFDAELNAGVADSRFLKKIKKKIKPFILRRKKEDVAKDLPEKIEQTVWVEMAAPQRQVYDEFLAGIRGNLLKKVEIDGISHHRMEVLEAILRLRQICCHPLLVSAHLDENQTATSSKLDILLQDLETILDEGRKVLVYSQFTSMLALIGKELRSKGWNFTYLDGSTTNRERVVNQFQEDPQVPIFLISLKAGGIGLNLTAADYVLLFDPWWNEAVENQAINRAHRIGRKDTVFAKRYLAQESIEEKIMILKEHKRLLIEDILDDETGNSCLTEQDLNFLLS
jgi:superfamily II DNA or RNA helicase